MRHTDEELLALYGIGDRTAPRLRANFIASLDGAATHQGLTAGLNNEDDKRVFDLLRRVCDVVLVGAGTIRAERYADLRLEAPAIAWRREHGLPAQPTLAIVSAELDLDPEMAGELACRGDDPLQELFVEGLVTRLDAPGHGRCDGTAR